MIGQLPLRLAASLLTLGIVLHPGTGHCQASASAAAGGTR